MALIRQRSINLRMRYGSAFHINLGGVTALTIFCRTSLILYLDTYLKARGVPTLVLGKPMEFWQKMPARMYLKSVLSASTLFDPDKAYSLNRFFQTTHIPIQEPLPLPLFLEYGRWFQQNAVPDI